MQPEVVSLIALLGDSTLPQQFEATNRKVSPDLHSCLLCNSAHGAKIDMTAIGSIVNL